VSNTTELVLDRHIRAPRELVYRYFVEPERLIQWLGVVVDIDPQVSGQFLVDMTGTDVVDGTYLELVAPERVVFTWGWQNNPNVPPRSSTVAVDLYDVDGEARLVLTHSGLPEPAVADHGSGWRYFLPRLETAAGGGDPGPVEPERIGEEQS
jgi:uncharacterized protein YndB with AHSA1/START domain